MPEAKRTKEQIYDEEISPLMTQVIAICKKHKIANVCSFSIADSEEGLFCTTAMTEEEFDPPDTLKELVRILYPRKSPTMMTVRDGNGNVKEMHAFLD